MASVPSRFEIHKRSLVGRLHVGGRSARLPFHQNQEQDGGKNHCGGLGSRREANRPGRAYQGAGTAILNETLIRLWTDSHRELFGRSMDGKLARFQEASDHREFLHGLFTSGQEIPRASRQKGVSRKLETISDLDVQSFIDAFRASDAPPLRLTNFGRRCLRHSKARR